MSKSTSTVMRECAMNVLQVVMKHQRRSSEAPLCTARPCARCAELHLGRILEAMQRSEPIHFVLPGFPGKSPNLRKVFGPLPDMGEMLALEFLQSLADRIAEIYAPGAQFIICSDGRVFSDLVRIRDEDITQYQDAIRDLIRDKPGLAVFNLDHVWERATFDDMRQHLCEQHAESIDSIRQRVQAEAEARSLYLGITRFLFEDAKGIPSLAGLSNTAIQKDSKTRAYGVLQRSKAWGDLIAVKFPRAVRLSIHPQSCGSEKLGINLSNNEDNWLTPWHAVSVSLEGEHVLMKRSEAEALGATVVHQGGRPSHFELSKAQAERRANERTSDMHGYRAVVASEEARSS